MSRDRDPEGRALNARARDALGRPLPRGARGVEPLAEGRIVDPAATLTEAQRLLDTGLPFQAHEVLEAQWKAAPRTERDLWQGLAQLAVGLTHLLRGNAVGGARLLDRGAQRLGAFVAAPPYGIDAAGLVSWAHSLTDAGPADNPPAPPRLRGS